MLASATGAPIYKINEETMAQAEVQPRLAAIFATREQKVMFVRGDKSLDYSLVAEVVDYGKQAGVDNIGLMTPQVEAGH